jgi:hypothetical protein
MGEIATVSPSPGHLSKSVVDRRSRLPRGLARHINGINAGLYKNKRLQT